MPARKRKLIPPDPITKMKRRAARLRVNPFARYLAWAIDQGLIPPRDYDNPVDEPRRDE